MTYQLRLREEPFDFSKEFNNYENRLLESDPGFEPESEGLEPAFADLEKEEEARGGPRAAGSTIRSRTPPMRLRLPPPRRRRPPRRIIRPWRVSGGVIHEPVTCICPEPTCPEHGEEYIRWVQSALNHALGLRLPLNGVMGPETRSAVRSFQEREGLPVTGIVGPDIERALIAASGGKSVQARATEPAEPGMTEPAEPAATPPEPDSAKPAAEFDMEDMELWEMPFELEWGHCPHCGLPREEFEFELTDTVINPPSSSGSHGKASSFKNPTTTTKRCKGGVVKTCPTLPGLEDVSQVSGIGFEYIAGWTDKHEKKHPGIIFSNSTGKWIVVEKNRGKNRVHKLLPRAGDALATFIANMKAINMPIEAILTMGSVYCRCIGGTTNLSNHSYGDAIDIGGLRFVGGQEVLVANSGDAADRKLLHRVNACLRLSFATVLDYHDKKDHWNHFHCDTNILNGGERRLTVAWPFVRESLGLSPKGGWDKKTKEPANSLRQFAGADDAVDDRPTLNRTLSRLFMREATRV